jgi:RNA polymerase-binding transcription factor DksA
MTPRNGSTSKAAKKPAAKAATPKAVGKSGAAAKVVAKGSAPRPAAAKAAAAKNAAKPAAPKPLAPKPAIAPKVVGKAAAPKPAPKPVAPAPRPAAPKPPVPKPPGPKPTPAPVVTRVMKEDLKFLEKRLLEERGRLLKELGYLEANVLKQNQRDSSGDLSGYSFHMADLGTDAMEREKAFLFASAEGRALYDVDEALRRIYSGNYGLCETCQQPIAKERLEVVPGARLCIRCKQLEEKAGRR